MLVSWHSLYSITVRLCFFRLSGVWTKPDHIHVSISFKLLNTNNATVFWKLCPTINSVCVAWPLGRWVLLGYRSLSSAAESTRNLYRYRAPGACFPWKSIISSLCNAISCIPRSVLQQNIAIINNIIFIYISFVNMWSLGLGILIKLY